MSIQHIGSTYLKYLEKGDVSKILSLFTKDALVVSPVYGTLPAKEFYRKLKEDTKESIIRLDGIFTEEGGERIVMVFDYKWTLRNGEEVDFKVADILEFDPVQKIKKLLIIYDTVGSRELVNSLN